jgi:hypothetical protein
MIHNITAGHFGRDGSVTRPLDLKIVERLLKEYGDGTTLGGWKVRFEDGCVILPWKGGRTNRVAEEFAIRLQRETGCGLMDIEHGRVIEAGELVAERKAVG